MTTKRTVYASVMYAWISLLAALFLAIMATAPIFGDSELQSFFPWLVNPSDRRIWLSAALACAATFSGMLSGFQLAKAKFKP